MKKVLYLILVFAMVIALFSGCNNSSQNNESNSITKAELDPSIIGDTGGIKLPLDDKYTEISILANTDFSADNDSVVINELRRRTGLNVQIITVSPSTFEDKVKIYLASKDSMPDVFTLAGLPTADNHDISMQGAFEPINKHLDELPNLKEIFYNNPEKYKANGLVKYYSAPDGNLYIFPAFNNNRDVNHGMLYRKDIFDKNGLRTWNTTDEFYQDLKALKNLYPESTPLITKNGIGIIRDLGTSWGINGFDMYFDEETSLWEYSATDEKFKNLLDFMKKLYNEGLLDPEFLTRTSADWTSRMTQESKAFVTWDWIDRMNMFKEQTAQTIPDYDLRYAYPIGPMGKVLTLTSLQGGPNIAKNKKSLLSMKLCDYLLSESGAQLMTLGIKGVTYDLDEQGKAKYFGFDGGDENASISSLEERYGMFIGCATMRFDKRSIYFNYTKRTQEAQDLMLNKEGGGFMPVDPLITFTKEESEIKNKYEADLQKAAEEFATNYIMKNGSGDAAWTAWLQKAEKLGVNEMENVYNEAQKRFD